MERTRWTDERGSALPLMAIVLGGVALALAVVLVQTEHRVRVARAQWAADGAALAAATDVRPGLDDGGPEARLAATEVAEANGASVVSVQVVARQTGTSHLGIVPLLAVSPTVEVEVEFGGVVARASAARFAVADP